MEPQRLLHKLGRVFAHQRSVISLRARSIFSVKIKPHRDVVTRLRPKVHAALSKPNHNTTGANNTRMKKRRVEVTGLRRWLWVAMVGAVIGVAAQVAAQSPPKSGGFNPSPEEAEVLKLYRENKLIGARTKSQAILENDPNSVVAHFVLGQVFREAEGLLPKAMIELAEARKLMEQKYGSQPPVGVPAQLHQEILFATQGLAGEMEEYEFQLQILDYHDALYEPDLLAERAWVLLHLNRLADARAAATKAQTLKDPWQQSLGKNALCGIEGEAQTRQPFFDACMAALKNAQEKAAASKAGKTTKKQAEPEQQIAVHAFNAATSALAALKPEEAEKLALMGTQNRELTIANPWRVLARLYADQSRMVEAVSAAGEMQQWRMRLPANLRDQDRAETDVALATLLLAVGEPNQGLKLVDRAIDQPDRHGLVSSKAEQAFGGAALLRRALQRVSAEREAEKLSVTSSVQAVRGVAVAAWEKASTLPDDARIAGILADESRLKATLRPYLSGGLLPVPSWILGDLIDVLGAGVMAVTLEKVRQEEASFAPVTPYLDALEAEIALAQGQYSKGLSLIEKALGGSESGGAGLPKGESLLRARVAGIGAELARRAGDQTRALAYYEQAMQKDPGAIRRLGLSIPTTITNPIEEELSRAAEKLARSPRLRLAKAGEPSFNVDLQREGAYLSACLRSSQGTNIGCVRVMANSNQSPEERINQLLNDFHTQLFAARIGLSAVDIRSLDGSNSLASQAQRAMIQNALDEISKQ